jgi:RNA polymerase sigma-70 factor (ECF subfamily)
MRKAVAEAAHDTLDGSLPGNARDFFAATRWSLVRRAVTDFRFLDEWIGLYWYPLYAWARRRGMTPEDSADGVQSFLAKLCSRELLTQVDATRGRLRAWLLTSFSNHLSTARAAARTVKRGGDSRHIPIEWTQIETAYLADSASPSSPEAIYARTWVLTLMEEALAATALHYEKSGRSDLFEALLPALEAPLPETTYAELASRFSISGQVVRQTVVRMRQRYRRALLGFASTRLGISSEAELESEIRALLTGRET